MHKLFFFFSLLLLSLFSYADKPTSLKLTLTSPDFSDQTRLPVNFTCDGTEISPTLNWTSIPANTKSLALILSDPDAPNGTFYHWIIFNIPTNATGLPQDLAKLPDGAKAGKNTAGTENYKAPCPPKGPDHHYIFTLYALDTLLNLPEETNAETLLNAMQNHILGKAQLTATYNH